MVVPGVRVEPGAARRAESLRRAEPRTAADPPAATGRRCSRAAIPGIAIVTVVPTILGPFPDIAVYVVKPPGVWLEAANWHCALSVLTLGTARVCRIYRIAIV